jgi:hypothetical protein
MTPKSIARRAGAIVIAVLPVALHVTSVMSAHRSPYVLIGEAFAMIALIVGAMDFYVVFLRRKLPRVSPAPLVGTILVIAAGAFAYGDRPTAIFALFSYAIDTAGPPWFIFARWNDESLWG